MPEEQRVSVHPSSGPQPGDWVKGIDETGKEVEGIFDSVIEGKAYVCVNNEMYRYCEITTLERRPVPVGLETWAAIKVARIILWEERKHRQE